MNTQTDCSNIRSRLLRWNPSPLLRLLVAALFTVVMFDRAKDIIVNASFWGEDGGEFWVRAFSHPSFQGVFLPYAGYLHVLPRVVALACVPFPMTYAPLIMTCASIAIASTPLFYIVSARAAFLGAPAIRLCLCAMYAMFPFPCEPYGNMANAQFYGCAISLLILYCDSASKPLTVLEFALLSVLAATGPFAMLIIFALAVTGQYKKAKWKMLPLCAGAISTLYCLHLSSRATGAPSIPDFISAITVALNHVTTANFPAWFAAMAFSLLIAASLRERNKLFLSLFIVGGLSILAATCSIFSANAGRYHVIMLIGMCLSLPSSRMFIRSWSSEEYARASLIVLVIVCGMPQSLNYPAHEYDSLSTWESTVSEYNKLQPGASIRVHCMPEHYCGFTLTKPSR